MSGFERARCRVIGALMAEPGRRYFGYDLGKQARVRPGRVYRVLDEFLERGWVRDGWDTAWLPNRRYYELTDEGRRELAIDLAQCAANARKR